MSSFDGEDGKREIIIVRRGGGDHEEGHHGGVWKIAFADFMTAMMCFFLVMWLVNAANEETKAAVASYFNPMTLVDQMPSNEGGEQSNPAESPDVNVETTPEKTEEKNKQSGPGSFANSVDSADKETTSDAHLFSDPYAVLAEIAAETAMLQNISAKGDGGAQSSGPATGASGGESYRDPFAPDFWSHEVADSVDAELNVFREPQDIEPSSPPVPEMRPDPADVAAEEEAAQADVAAAAEAGADAQAPAPAAEPGPGEPSQATQQLAQEIRDEIAEAFGADSALNQAISVTARSEGVLISVTDELNFGMFQIGSAVPRGELVLAMEKIGRTLNDQPGRVRINGHTDGRPFKNGEYDNGRLSTARAHSAYYMLVRAGLEEARIKEVAGFADRDLKIPEDPFADANRRIEIFLEAGG